jgi:hypothetical protein
MATPDLFRARLAHLIDPRHPLAVLATRMPWAQLEAADVPPLSVAELFGVRAHFSRTSARCFA